MKNCIKCGAELNDTAKFCRKCGAKQEQTGKVFCENCGAELSADAEFCENCGAKVITAESQAFGNQPLIFGTFSNAEAESAFEAGIAALNKQSEDSSLAMFDWEKAPNGEITIKKLLNKNILRIEVPDGVTAIADNAFENAIIADVKLPQSLIYIGKRAFAGCKNLMQINIPQNVAIINDEAFADDTELEITIPTTVKILGFNVLLNTKTDIKQKKEDAERKAREETERKAREEAERKAREEAERKEIENMDEDVKDEIIKEYLAKHGLLNDVSIDEFKEEFDYLKTFVGKVLPDPIGMYIQDNSGIKRPIEWQLLDVDEKKWRALIISRYALDTQKYNTSGTDVTWENCSLRKWLNGTFLNEAFNSEERSMILSSKVSADENPNYSTNPGNATTDKIFLLSISEVKKYFSSDEDRKCVPTEYAISHGAYTNSKYTKGGAATCWWWLRSPGCNQRHAANVSYGGSVSCYGLDVNYDFDCVRPALWINLDS